MRTRIGEWNGYSVYLNKEKGGVHWTIESSNGKIHNTFESPESFGHWVFHSGFKPGNERKLGFKLK